MISVFGQPLENCSITNISFVAGCKRRKVVYCFDRVGKISWIYTPQVDPQDQTLTLLIDPKRSCYGLRPTSFARFFPHLGQGTVSVQKKPVTSDHHNQMHANFNICHKVSPGFDSNSFKWCQRISKTRY